VLKRELSPVLIVCPIQLNFGNTTILTDTMGKNITLLTSPDAVKAAIAECDMLGREGFLSKYGYKRATKYPLVFEGREYDSKAIAGVAYGKEHGAPLKWADFSGGVRHGVVPTLHKLGFQVRSVAGTYKEITAVDNEHRRNPRWSRDELMLALHLYMHYRQSPPSKTSKKVVELSEFLSAMCGKSKTLTTFRNPSGVYMKLMNFRSLDPDFTLVGKRGLTRNNKDEQFVWNLYIDCIDHLDDLVVKIKSAVQFDVKETGIDLEDELEIEDCEEGRVFTRMHRFRERNRKLITTFKDHYRKRHGELQCAGCDNDFSEKYGGLADRLIDVHHTKPVHTLNAGDKTSPKDLVLLCASCHRAVHAQKRWLTVAELRQQIGKSP
jgi:5-methylcytosine-specific restriction protein A